MTTFTSRAATSFLALRPRILLLAVLAFAAVSASTSLAQMTFRGLLRDQGNNVYDAPPLDRTMPFFIDVKDNFRRDGLLSGSEADELQIGFVPPYEGVPLGELTGDAAEAHGRWLPELGSEYRTRAADDGRAYRATGEGVAIAYLPWRVEPQLGDDYLIELTASVAAGEVVSLGYLGDIVTHGAADGLAGRLGQLVLDIERGTGEDVQQLTWTLSWDTDGGRASFPGTTTAPEGEAIVMQLGWRDNRNGDDDYDAWLKTSAGYEQLLSGNMNTAIDVFSVGFEIADADLANPVGDGTGSYITSYTAAVPEPHAGLLLIAGCLGLCARKRGQEPFWGIG